MRNMMKAVGALTALASVAVAAAPASAQDYYAHRGYHRHYYYHNCYYHYPTYSHPAGTYQGSRQKKKKKLDTDSASCAYQPVNPPNLDSQH